MATIKPIEGRSVHQIQSGQVIVDLNSVVKELVENSLDAGATSIEVRFRNNGLDAIEVQDNGAGIAPEDFDTIALKHYTSKLSTYDDLTHLQTFGFRGEALSSLCALSKFHIVTTRAVDGPKGTKLNFEQSGKLKGTSVVAAKQGTTVVVEDLFHNLPVRRKELEKTVKREYNKVLQLLNAYACISVGVKLSVSNQVPKGKKTVAFSTNANPNTKENIANVYGAKTLLALIPLDLRFEMHPSTHPGSTQSAQNRSTQEDNGSREVRIVGHISRPVVGEGRQTPDRQMFFVNSRPCQLPQVSKAFNEVYKSYNITQSPFIFADIRLDTNAYDVNVSPDKRTILLHDQTALLENLKNSLTDLFEAHDQSVPSAQLLGKQVPTFKPPTRLQPESTGASARERSMSTPQESRPATEDPASSDSPEPALPGFVRASLIERFADRDTESRGVRHPVRKRKSVSPERYNTSTGVADSDEASSKEQDVTASEAPAELSQFAQLPQAVRDFNARIASQHAKQVAREISPISPIPEEADEREEERIPAITQIAQKGLTQSTIQNAFDRMRPMRTPAQKATITVGDTTTETIIGSESRASKRARIHIPKFSLDGAPLSETRQRPVFLKSLRGFAAPGTQMEGSNEEDEEDRTAQEVDSESDDNVPSPHPARSPSPQMRAPLSRSFIGTSDAESLRFTSTPTASLDEDKAESEPVIILEQDESCDDEYVDESEKKAHEEAKVAQMIAEAEEAATRPSEYNLKRADKLLSASRKKFKTINLERLVKTSTSAIARQIHHLASSLEQQHDEQQSFDTSTSFELNSRDPEERLSLTVSKADFLSMRIIGQFNLGFILALRAPTAMSPTPDLFIIDQHASDEKYNFERFSNTTVLESQHMVHPRPLELTAVEEEVMLNNEPALTANGFKLSIDTSGALPVGRRAKLTSLPTSKGVTFTPTDLEELLALLLESPLSASDAVDGRYIPRPSKVRKLLASRACRSSVMVGKTLKSAQMARIVANMGGMDKPWSCPHGRPTMRHLFSLEKWEGWGEGDGVAGLGEEREMTDWAAFMDRRRRIEGN